MKGENCDRKGMHIIFLLFFCHPMHVGNSLKQLLMTSSSLAFIPPCAIVENSVGPAYLGKTIDRPLKNKGA